MPSIDRQPFFKIEATYREYFITVIPMLGAVITTIYFVIQIWYSGWANLGWALFFLGVYFYSRRGVKEYLLFDDKLVVRMPLTFSRKTDDIFYVSDIKEVIFRKGRRQARGPYLVIRCRKRMHKTYVIDFQTSTIDDFRNAFSKTGVVIKSEGL